MVPVIDLHCDLLSYLTTVEGANPYKQDEIGAAVPHLQAGNVRLQVMAMYTDTKQGSTLQGLQQTKLYSDLGFLTHGFFSPINFADLKDGKWIPADGCQTLAAIENASAFCEESEPIDKGFERLEDIIAKCGPLAYIIITHHYENRFGGGNYTEVGLKPDGELLLDYLDGRRIPVDLAHTSDKLAYGILNYLDKKNLDVPVLASHSNFRHLHSHVRNLPDELVQELVQRRGLIGINFLRNYIHQRDPAVLFDHIRHGITMGASHLLAFGADFFYALNHPDPSRYPIYFPGQDNASVYQAILSEALARGNPESFCEDIAYKNVVRYYTQLYAHA